MTRFGLITATALAAAGVGYPGLAPMPVKLIWNASASAPIGLYAIEAAGAIKVPDLVAVLPPEPLAQFMVARGYVGRGVPLLKRVLGLPGQRVCRAGRTVTVDGVEMGEALERDRMGRELLVWRGCRTIAPDELFLMNRGVSDSFDGRYFGPLPAAAVIGRALPLFTDEDGDGRFVWRARTPLIPLTALPPKENIMANIGAFQKTKTGYTGHIRTLVIDAAVVLIPTKKSDAEHAPDFRIHRGDANGPEVGAAWKETGDKAGEYLSLQLDDPTLAQPIRANLFRSDDDDSAWSLHWNRPKPRNARD